MGSKRIPTSPTSMGAAERREKIMELRMRGWNFRKIGEAVGCNGSYAYKVMRTELDRLIEKTALSTQQLRKLELEKLDVMETKLAPAVQKNSNIAIRTWLKVLERRSKFLGLDAPTKIEGSITGSANVQIYLPENHRGDQPEPPEDEDQTEPVKL